jgi:tetratricopeptide (TPR) repeat protein
MPDFSPARRPPARRLTLILALALALVLTVSWRALAAWWCDDMGNIALARGDAASAQTWFDRGISLYASQLLLEDRGRARLDTDPAGALRDFQAAACGAACTAEAGDAQSRLGDADAAVADYLDAHAAGRLAAAVERIAQRGQYDEALRLERALATRLDGNLLERADLGAAFSTIGKLDVDAAKEAERETKRARAAAYRRDAIASFGKATTLAPFNEGYLLSYAFSQMLWGDKREARSAFRRVLALHPHQSDAEQALARIGPGDVASPPPGAASPLPK